MRQAIPNGRKIANVADAKAAAMTRLMHWKAKSLQPIVDPMARWNNKVPGMLIVRDLGTGPRR